jgi:hypothetical protein
MKLRTRPPVAPPADDLTLWGLARELMPSWTPHDWLRWPPDVFALTSSVLKATGVYRFAVTPFTEKDKKAPRLCWSDEKSGQEREAELVADAERWSNWLLSGASDRSMPRELKRLRAALAAGGARFSSEPASLSQETCSAVRDLFKLHALADTTCSAFGIPCMPQGGRAPLVFWANLLLEQTGSLSRLPKRHGIVLPKMRTPQGGLTPRSFSHHLTFHQSEVNINWRTVPWVNQNEDTINILAVPLPYEVTANEFYPYEKARGDVFPGQDTDLGRVKYFMFEPRSKFNPGLVLDLVKKAQREAGRVHLLVFPELALCREDLDLLKAALESEIALGEIPMIVTGLRGNHPNGMGLNQVMLSFYAANKWYDLDQDKHHRWKLDDRQIQMYSLASTLNSNYKWWEGIALPRRELTLMCPNGWLTLCPLICEDLAQLEPVSSLIRGVGPTLVIALLLDGPQITDRWSARYVGVLADDPGSSILTVTSVGMAHRSRDRGKPPNRTAVLWKDQERGWEQIELKEGRGAVLLTINAKFKEEFTADGRSDHKAAPLLVLQGVRSLELPREGSDRKTPEGSVSSSSKDVEELTIMEYLVDAIVDSGPDFAKRFKELSNGQLGKFGGESRFARLQKSLDRLTKNLVVEGFGNITPAAADPGSTLFDKPLVQNAFRSVFQLVMRVNSSPELAAGLARGREEPLDASVRRWLTLVDTARSWLEQTYDEEGPRDPVAARAVRDEPDGRNEYVRLRFLIFLSILWAVHNRLLQVLKNRSRKQRPNAEVIGECRRGVKNIEELFGKYRTVLKPPAS